MNAGFLFFFFFFFFIVLVSALDAAGISMTFSGVDAAAVVFVFFFFVFFGVVVASAVCAPATFGAAAPATLSGTPRLSWLRPARSKTNKAHNELLNKSFVFLCDFAV
jgi:hypothetical protein